MVKVLMLHGFGTNANIFKVQTASMRLLLPSHWEYHFIEGDLECEPALGISEVYSDQIYKCWFNLPNVKVIEAAHDILAETIEEEGPFDVAWGFSQGATIIASFLLQHALEYPDASSPFRSAIFMNAEMPYSAIPQFGIDVTPLVITFQKVPCTLAEAKIALDRTNAQMPSQAAMIARLRNSEWKDDESISDFIKKALQSMIDEEKAQGAERTTWEDFATRRMFVEIDSGVKIGIPTAHFVSEEDDVRALGEMMAKLCEEKRRTLYTSSGGHAVPKLDRDVRKACQIIERTVDKAGFDW